ncbi:MAG: ATP-binding protein [Bacilli bacterium]|nr:ATP-binding protein [Bacilli bacterium]
MSYYKQVINSLYQDSTIKKFILENKLSEEEIINNLSALTTQKENNKIINSNPERCLLDPYGMASYISFENGKVELTYYQVKTTDDKLERLFFPNKEEVLNQELYKDAKRVMVLKEVLRIENNYKPRQFFKGIFIHGNFGTGKSFIMQKLAISLSNKGANVIIAYYPDLVRTIKSSITSRDTEVIINKLKHADVLMLDDIGAETNTNFIRDEVLGPILQYRMESKLPMCMTSNLDLKDLRSHFEDTYSGANKINSDRIISRIRSLMVEVNLIDKNYRDL